MKKAFRWSSIIVLILIVFPITFGQFLPFEFQDNEIERYYYFILITILAVSFSLLIFGNIKAENNRDKNLKISLYGILTGIFYLILIFCVFIFVGFGKWVNYTVLYRNKLNNNFTINEQIYDVGAFGYGKRRTVKINATLKYILFVENIDTTKINKAEWNFVNEKGNIKIP